MRNERLILSNVLIFDRHRRTKELRYRVAMYCGVAALTLGVLCYVCFGIVTR